MDLLSKTKANSKLVWLFNTLPHWKYCVTSEVEPKNIDCAEKYPRFHAACQGSIKDPTASCVKIPIL